MNLRELSKFYDGLEAVIKPSLTHSTLQTCKDGLTKQCRSRWDDSQATSSGSTLFAFQFHFFPEFCLTPLFITYTLLQFKVEEFIVKTACVRACVRVCVCMTMHASEYAVVFCPSQQLFSCRDGQFPYQHFFYWTNLPKRITSTLCYTFTCK